LITYADDVRSETYVTSWGRDNYSGYNTPYPFAFEDLSRPSGPQ